jgi:hypothetical protein
VSFRHPNPIAAGFIVATNLCPAAKFRLQRCTKEKFPNGFRKSGGTIFETKRLLTRLYASLMSRGDQREDIFLSDAAEAGRWPATGLHNANVANYRLDLVCGL